MRVRVPLYARIARVQWHAWRQAAGNKYKSPSKSPSPIDFVAEEKMDPIM